MIRPLSALEPGDSGTVDRLDLHEEVRMKLLELGLGPGEIIRLVRRAPFGDPLEIELLGYRLALRRQEADRIFLQCLP